MSKKNKEMSMREMLKITRNLNEIESRKTAFDQKTEEEKLLNNFQDMNVHINFSDLIVTDDYVFWGGTINGVIQFAYAVTDNKADNNVTFNYLEDFSPDNPENDQIVSRIESYYNEFFKYWNENLIQKSADDEDIGGGEDSEESTPDLARE